MRLAGISMHKTIAQTDLEWDLFINFILAEDYKEHCQWWTSMVNATLTPRSVGNLRKLGQKSLLRSLVIKIKCRFGDRDVLDRL
jgi:hypothetical protein